MIKRKKGEQRQGTCTYCGAEGFIEDEHVFPRQWFLVQDLEMITVPACGACNDLKEKGDSDLLMASIMMLPPGAHPDLIEQVEKMAKRPRKAKWMRKVIGESPTVPLTNDDGVIIDVGIEIPFNFEHVWIMLPMVMRGLFFKEAGRRLPSDCPVEAHLVPLEGGPLVVNRLSAIRNAEPRFKGNNIVWWIPYFPDDADENTSAWLVCLFNNIVIQGSTGTLAEKMLTKVGSSGEAEERRQAREAILEGLARPPVRSPFLPLIFEKQ